MRSLIIEEKAIKQAQLLIFRDRVTIRFPFYLDEKIKSELKLKFLKVADELSEVPIPLKAYYKIETPFLFLNKTLENGKRETIYVYEMNKL